MIMFLLNQVLPLLYWQWINNGARDTVCNNTCNGMEGSITTLRSKYCWSHHVTRSSAKWYLVTWCSYSISQISQLASQYLYLHLNLAEDGRQDKVYAQVINRALKREIYNLQKYPKSDKTAHTWTADSTFDWAELFSTISQSGFDSCCVLDTSSVDLTTSTPLGGSRIKAWYNSRWPFTRDLALCHKSMV